MKKIVSLILAAVLLFSLTGCASFGTDAEKLKFKAVDGGYALERYTGNSSKTSFTVPDTYQGQKVVEIKDFAIANAEYLAEIIIGKNVERIGEKTRGINNCVALKAIQVSEENPYFTAVDGVLYSKDMTELLVYPNARTPFDEKNPHIFKLPDTVKKISNSAFYQCKNLQKIEFNEGLREIGDMAFIKCEKLQNFVLPSTLESIGADAFSYCNELTELTIPANVKIIGDYAFFSLSSQIEKITVERANLDGMTVGKDWLPTLKDLVNKKSEIVFAP